MVKMYRDLKQKITMVEARTLLEVSNLRELGFEIRDSDNKHYVEMLMEAKIDNDDKRKPKKAKNS